MGSFKLRLVAYFILLSLLPLIAVSWAFSNLAAKSEVERADSRLGVALRVAAAEYESEMLHALHLQVRPDNPAQRLYRRAGFTASPRITMTRRF